METPAARISEAGAIDVMTRNHALGRGPAAAKQIAGKASLARSKTGGPPSVNQQASTATPVSAIQASLIESILLAAVTLGIARQTNVSL
jgi:hypothetical protein